MPQRTWDGELGRDPKPSTGKLQGDSPGPKASLLLPLERPYKGGGFPDILRVFHKIHVLLIFPMFS